MPSGFSTFGRLLCSWILCLWSRGGIRCGAAQPEAGKQRFKRAGTGLPVRGHQAAVGCLAETVIDEDHNPAVVLGADDAAGGLRGFLHSRDLIGIQEAVSEMGIVPCSERLLLRTDLREPDPDHHDPVQACSGKINALGKDAAEHTQRKHRLISGEVRREKGIALFERHGRLLHLTGEIEHTFCHLKKSKTGKEHDIPAAVGFDHGADHLRDPFDGLFPGGITHIHIGLNDEQVFPRIR